MYTIYLYVYNIYIYIIYIQYILHMYNMYIYIYVCVTVIPIMIIKTSAKKECDDCAKPIEEVAATVAVRRLLWKVTIQISKSSENHSDIPANQRRFQPTSCRVAINGIKNYFGCLKLKKFTSWTLLMEMRMNPGNPGRFVAFPHMFRRHFRRVLEGA